MNRQANQYMYQISPPTRYLNIPSFNFPNVPCHILAAVYDGAQCQDSLPRSRQYNNDDNSPS